MAVASTKKAEAERRARALYRRLMLIERDFSNNDWTVKAGVNTSFFTNLQGKSKPPSEPSIGNLRSILEAAGTSVPEFFVHEANGKVVRPPTKQELAEVIREAWPSMPKQQERRPEFLAEAVLDALALPANSTAIPANEDDEAVDVRAAASPPPGSTS